MTLRFDDELFVIPSRDQYLVFAPRRGCLLLTGAPGVDLLAKVRDSGWEGDEPPHGIFRALEESGVINGSSLPPVPTAEDTPYAPSSVTLFLSNRCNLACVYCYAEQGCQRDMAMDPVIAHAAIDKALKHAKEGGKACSVNFHGGGEPTMAWSLLQDAVTYAQDQAKTLEVKCTFGLTTNGCVEPDQAEWLAARFSNISISCDGPPEFQDRNRPLRDGSPSSPIVARTVAILQAAGVPYAFQSTVTRDMVDRIPEIVEYLCHLGKPRSVKLEPVSEVGRFSGHSREVPVFDGFAKKLDEAFDVALRNGVGIDFPAFRLTGMPQSTFCGTCQTPFSVTPDGFISACYEACWEGADHGDRLLIGQYDRDRQEFIINAQRLAELRRRHIHNMPGCQNCFCKYACAGDCPVRNWRAADRKDASILATGVRCDLIRSVGAMYLRRLADGNILFNSAAQSLSDGKANSLAKEKEHV